MAITVPSITGTTLGTSSTTVYTVPNTAGMFLIIKGIIIMNYTTSAVTVSMARVASGGSEADSNRFLKDATIAPKQSLFINETITLAQNESIRGLCSAATSVVVTISGAGQVT